MLDASTGEIRVVYVVRSASDGQIKGDLESGSCCRVSTAAAFQSYQFS
ncbi:hypothetical protein [Stieleria marina]